MADRTITAEAIINARDGTGDVFTNIAKKIQGIGNAAKISPQIEGVTKALAKATDQLKALDKFQSSREAFTAVRSKFNAAQAAVEGAAKAMATAQGPAKQLASQYAAAQRAVTSASAAFEKQKSAVLAAKHAIEGFGTPIGKVASEQARLRSAIESTNKALERQVAAQHKVGAGSGFKPGAALAAGAGLAASYQVKNFASKAIVSAAEFDIGTRKQREFTDISAVDQASILTPQAKKIGQDTQFSNLDVVKAQTKAMQGLPSGITGKDKAEVAAGIMENVKNYALVMEADLATSAEAIRSFLQTTNQDIGTKEKAVAASNKATNQLVKMAKLGGMNDEDVQGYLKFAAASGTAAGLSPESMMARRSSGHPTSAAPALHIPQTLSGAYLNPALAPSGAQSPARR